MKNSYRVLTQKNKNFFLPENFPGSVKGRYLDYVKFNLVQQGSSSALGVLSTQQLLLALGSESLTASAALNWVIKDGLGQLGGIVYAGKTGNKFDADSKYQKWLSALSINVSCFVEILSPLCPAYFLIFASLGMLGKNISAISGSASRAAFHLNFANSNNLADITAKNTIQTTAVCVAGTFIGTFCGYFVTSYAVGFQIFCGFSALHLWAAFKGLKIIEINSLNQQRLDIVLEEFRKSGRVLGVEETAKREVFLKPYFGEVEVGADKVFKEFQRFKGYLIGKKDGQVCLLYEEGVSSEDMINGYAKAYEEAKGKIEGFQVGMLKEAGWETSINYISPNSIRVKFDD